MITNFYLCIYNKRILYNQYLRQVKMYVSLFLFQRLFLLNYRNQTTNKKFLLELIIRRSSTNQPIRVCLWLVCKITKNNCCSLLFTEFIQTQKRHPTSIDKVSILIWRLHVISRQKFSFELNSTRTYSLCNI